MRKVRQDKFMEQYFQSQREQIFTSVGVLIYVFEVTSRDWEKDLKYYEDCLKALSELSSNANIFCLIHKMDLIPEKEREKEFAKKSKEIVARSQGFNTECYKTSIWDETLFQAWSNIVHVLIPNSKALEKQLGQFSIFTGADETVLFERHTFLVISHTDVKGHVDSHRFEKISNIIKQFKLSCIKTNYAFQALVVKNKRFTAIIEEFTKTTFIMVIVSNPAVEEEAVHLNVKAIRSHFEEIIST